MGRPHKIMRRAGAPDGTRLQMRLLDHAVQATPSLGDFISAHSTCLACEMLRLPFGKWSVQSLMLPYEHFSQNEQSVPDRLDENASPVIDK